jgi:hypothetical protein
MATKRGMSPGANITGLIIPVTTAFGAIKRNASY